MQTNLFGTDGVRGLAGEYPLNHDGCLKIGMAVGMQFAEPGETVVIAADPRQSSEQIVADITEGLNRVGVNVVNIGVITTPGLAYVAMVNDEFVAGIMITASHNPYQYNGVKVFDGSGNKLSSEVEAKLSDLIASDIPDRGQGQQTQRPELCEHYEHFLLRTSEGLDLAGMKLGLDTANGAASVIAPKLFKSLGAEVSVLSDQPNGININEHCGATDMKQLEQAMRDQQLELGIALDGDADRVLMVDEKGREVRGDYLLYVLALANGYKNVVATVMSNYGFEMALKNKGVSLTRTDVGDHFVIEELARTGYKLGGEESGHIVQPDLLATGDGLLAAVQVLRALKRSGKKLSDWCDEVELVPQALVNITVQDKSAIRDPAVQAWIKSKNDELAGKGRLLIRPSGTEPLIRVMVEADNAEQLANSIGEELKGILKQ